MYILSKPRETAIRIATANDAVTRHSRELHCRIRLVSPFTNRWGSFRSECIETLATNRAHGATSAIGSSNSGLR